MTRRSHAPETVVLFQVGDYRFAIAAGEVEEICATDCLVPLAAGCGGTRSVRHTFDRRGRRHLAVDAQVHLRIAAGTLGHILVLRTVDVGILISGIERMHDIRELYPLPRALQGAERKWYRGLALINHELIPVLDPAGFVPQELRAESTPDARAARTFAAEAVPA